MYLQPFMQELHTSSPMSLKQIIATKISYGCSLVITKKASLKSSTVYKTAFGYII